MKIRPFIFILGTLLITLIHTVNAAQCNFELPPNEQIIINGKQNILRTLSCMIENNQKNNDYLLHFFSEANTSFVNNLIMPEGTLMSLSFPNLSNNELNFVLKPDAKLGVTNDSPDFIRLKCRELMES